MIAMARPLARPIRVLVVDDSALVRKILQRGLSAAPNIEVVATAADPYVARDLLVQLRPDVMTLDVELPRMDGLTFLRKVMAAMPTPTVIVSALTAKGTKTALLALEAGAVSVVGKPKSGASDGLALMLNELVAQVRMAAASKVVPRLEARAAPRPLPRRSPSASTPSASTPSASTPSASTPPSSTPPSSTPSASTPPSSTPPSSTPPSSTPAALPAVRVIGLGASTGGVAALGQILPLFPAQTPGVVVVQHMPPGFTASFAEYMDDACQMRVREAVDGDRVEPGVILVAPGGGRHLRVVRDQDGARVSLEAGPLVNGHCPSVDVFFASLADLGQNAAACVLTGMGNDGAAGLKALRDAGGHTYAQDEATSAVWGMPGAAVALAAADPIALGAVPARLLQALVSSRQPRQATSAQEQERERGER
jgi:two-component system chemotaxis response regulator CheB